MSEASSLRRIYTGLTAWLKDDVEEVRDIHQNRDFMNLQQIALFLFASSVLLPVLFLLLIYIIVTIVRKLLIVTTTLQALLAHNIIGWLASRRRDG